MIESVKVSSALCASLALLAVRKSYTRKWCTGALQLA